MRRILVTGGNKGIGFALVRAILQSQQDSFVLLGSRSRERGQAAIDQLLADNPSWADRLELVELDVADQSSVSQAAAAVTAQYGSTPAPLYGVVNNAGVGFSTERLMDTLQVNVFGVHRVCAAFTSLIQPNGGRIVNITSAAGPSYVATCGAGYQARLIDPSISWDGIQAFMEECIAVEGGEEAFSPLGLGSGSSYGISKACANALTLHWARENPSLLVNACTPGFIETDLTRPFAQARSMTPAAMGMKSPKEGTHAPLFLLFGEPNGTGRYFGSDALRSPFDRYRSPGDPAYNGE